MLCFSPIFQKKIKKDKKEQEKNDWKTIFLYFVFLFNTSCVGLFVGREVL
jgi:hypothetical protein